jgi:hypothetical protein
LATFFAASLDFAATFSLAYFHLISFFVVSFTSASTLAFSSSRFFFFLAAPLLFL